MVFRRTGRVAVRTNISGATYAEVAVAVNDLAGRVVHARRTATRFCKSDDKRRLGRFEKNLFICFKPK